MREQAVYEMVCAILRERWGAAKAKPDLRLVGGIDVKNPAEVPETRQPEARAVSSRPTMDRLLAWKASQSR